MGANQLDGSLEKESQQGRQIQSAESESHGGTVTRSGTAKDWRGISDSLPNTTKEASGPLRNGTAQDWRAATADAIDDTKDAPSATGESCDDKKGTDTMRGGPFRG